MRRNQLAARAVRLGRTDAIGQRAAEIVEQEERDLAVIARIGGNDTRRALYAEHGALPNADRRFTPRKVYMSDLELQRRDEHWAYNVAEDARIQALMVNLWQNDQRVRRNG